MDDLFTKCDQLTANLEQWRADCISHYLSVNTVGTNRYLNYLVTLLSVKVLLLVK